MRLLGAPKQCLKASLERIELSTVCLEAIGLGFCPFSFGVVWGSGTDGKAENGKAVGVRFLFVVDLLHDIILFFLGSNSTLYILCQTGNPGVKAKALER
jgi:hypothetical protein